MTDEPSWLSFAELCDALAATRSKLAKRAAIAAYLRPLNAASAGLAAQYLTGAAFPETEERTLNVGSRLIVRALEAVTRATPETSHATYRKHGDLGATAEELLRLLPQPSSALALQEIAARLDALTAARVQSARSALLEDALRKAIPIEAKYLIKLLLGDMRTGVQQSLVEEAIAAAAEEPLAAVRRAGMLLGNLAEVVELAWLDKLETASFRMFHPLGFMLATPAASAEEAFARLESAGVNEDIVATDSLAVAKEPSAQIEDKYDECARRFTAAILRSPDASASSRELAMTSRPAFRRLPRGLPQYRNPRFSMEKFLRGILRLDAHCLLPLCSQGWDASA